jgi:protease PrsW
VNRIELLLLIVLAFLPPIIFAIWIRNTEKYNRQRWRSILLCFLWGATIAVIAAIILELVLEIPLSMSFEDNNTTGLLMVVVIAPFAEEFTKPLAVRLRRVEREINELEDGLIYGAVAGLGFSATENLLYGWSFLSEGGTLNGYSSVMIMFILFMALRSFGGCLLHAAATAWTGYGIGKSVINKTSALRCIPFFILACFTHGFYNFLVTFEIKGVVIGFFAAMIFVAFSIHVVRKKIKTLDTLSG